MQWIAIASSKQQENTHPTYRPVMFARHVETSAVTTELVGGIASVALHSQGLACEKLTHRQLPSMLPNNKLNLPKSIAQEIHFPSVDSHNTK
jgi:hypothetical protein